MKLLALILLLLASPAMAENRVAHEVNIGNGLWSVKSYVTDDNKFSHCVASTQFDAASEYHRKFLRSKSVAIILKLNADESYTFMLVGEDWNLNTGNIYKIDFDFNDNEHFEGKAVAADGQALEITAKPDTSGKWFTWLAKSSWVAISIDDRSLGKFALKKSKEAMTTLLNCYEGSKQGEAEVNMKDNSFGGGQGTTPAPESDFGPGTAQ